MYDQGMGIQVMWAFMSIGGLWCFLNCLFTWPAEVIPGDLSYLHSAIYSPENN